MTKSVHRKALAGIGLAAIVATAALVAAPSQAAGPRDHLHALVARYQRA